MARHPQARSARSVPNRVHPAAAAGAAKPSWVQPFLCNNFLIAIRPGDVQFFGLGARIRMAGPMWVMAGVMSWPPIFYSALALILLCKWTLWFPAMVLRHGLHGALDAALTCPGGVAGRSLTLRHTNRMSGPEPKGAAGVGV